MKDRACHEVHPGCRWGALAALLLSGCTGSTETGAVGPAMGGGAGSGGAASQGGASGDAGASGRGGQGGASGQGGGGVPGDICHPKDVGFGLSEGVSLHVGNLDRSFDVYVPRGLTLGERIPVVLVHHGATMSGKVMRELTDFTSLADAERFIAVFPNGTASVWDPGGLGLCGLGTLVPGVVDDLGFVEAIIDYLDEQYCIDRRAVFMTGFSMGGYFSNHTGCKRPELVRAVAPASGGGPPDDCVAGHMPVLIMHGSRDIVINPKCGPEARDKWVQHNGCSTGVDVRPIKGGRCEWSVGCPDDGQVVYCEFDKMSHGWAGHAGPWPYGGGEDYEDATKLAWEFFKAQL